MIKKLPGGSFRRARWRLESTEDGTVPAMRRSEKVDFVKDNFGSPYKHNLLRFVLDNLYFDFYVILYHLDRQFEGVILLIQYLVSWKKH
jgi:hypothetical protein